MKEFKKGVEVGVKGKNQKFNVGDIVCVTATREELDKYDVNEKIKEGDIREITEVWGVDCRLSDLHRGYVYMNDIEKVECFDYEKWSLILENIYLKNEIERTLKILRGLLR